MNGVISALVWCVIQVTVLTCCVAVVYLAARRVHPRAGAAAAGGGLLVVIALTAMLASPWPRWDFSKVRSENANASTEGLAENVGDAHANHGAPDVTPTMTNDSSLAVGVESRQPSYWELLISAINLPTGDEVVGTNQNFAAPRTETIFPRLVAWVFLVGGLVAAARLVWGLTGVRRLARSGRAVNDARVHAIVNELRGRLDLTDTVAVRESEHLATPATVGWRQPVILLPAAWREWSDVELRSVIAHELAHIAGRDYAAWFVARLAVVSHFYHPLVRWLAARLQLEQELAADMVAAQLVGNSKQYLHSLAALALSMPPNRMAGPARTLFPSRSLLVRRVEMLRTNGVNRPRRGAARYATFAVVTLTGLAAAGLRGPGIDLAASAVAEEPALPTKTKTAATGKQLGPELVPEGAAYVIYSPVNRILDDERLKGLTNQLRQVVDSEDPTGVNGKLLLDEIDEVIFTASKDGFKRGTRWIVRASSAKQLQPMLEIWRKNTTATKVMVGGQEVEFAPKANFVLRQLDERTAVFDEVTDALVLGELRGPLPPLKNPLPAWHEQWNACIEDGIAIGAVNIANAFANLAAPPTNVDSFQGLVQHLVEPLRANAEWAVFDLELKKNLRLRGTVQCGSEESAAKVRDTLQAMTTFAQNLADQYLSAMDAAVAQHGSPEDKSHLELNLALYREARHLLKNAKFEAAGPRVTTVLESRLVASDLVKIGEANSGLITQSQEAARRAQSMNNLRNLQLAMLNYEAANRVLPVAASHLYRAKVGDQIKANVKSKYAHSWRIDLLPYLEQQALYDHYRFDEPWNSEANKKVLARMPDVFRSPLDDGKSTNTSYFVFTGPQTVFPNEKDMPTPRAGGEPGGDFGEGGRYGTEGAVVAAPPVAHGRVRMVNISDGTSRTFSIVEAKRAVPWTKPEDIEFSADEAAPKIEGWVPGEFLAALVDGSVHRVSTDIDEATLRAWITRNGRENVKELPGPQGR